MKKLLTVSMTLLSSTAAYAGGYVAVVPNVPPVAGPGNVDGRVIAAIGVLGVLAWIMNRDGGGSSMPNEPVDHGGSCFAEGTLIMDGLGAWRPVETFREGQRVSTSKGLQTVLAVESWMPFRHEDRPVIYKGVRMSHNHGVQVVLDDGSELIRPVEEVGGIRVSHNGRRLYHILVENHAWVMVKGTDREAQSFFAETLALTNDMPKLAKRFPHLVEKHSTDPVIPLKEMESEEAA